MGLSCNLFSWIERIIRMIAVFEMAFRAVTFIERTNIVQQHGDMSFLVVRLESLGLGSRAEQKLSDRE